MGNGKNDKKVVFISNSVFPESNAGGGSIIIYRHLKKLQSEGYKVLFVRPSSLNGKKESEFEEIVIEKKAWYPPLRKKTPWLTDIRVKLYHNSVKDNVHFGKEDIIIGLFGEYINLLALKIAKTEGLELFMIYHDDNLFNKYERDNLLSKRHVKAIIHYTKHFFAVSKPMQQLLLNKGANSCSVLYPIPEGKKNHAKSISEVDRDQFKLCYAGLIDKWFHLPLIQTTSSAIKEQNAILNLVGECTSDLKTELRKLDKVELHKRFSTVQNLFDYLIKEIDAIIIFYSFQEDEEIRKVTSFPSKFCEYSHLAMPIIIFAPQESAIGKWAIENNWKCYIRNNSSDELRELIDKLKQKDFWNLCREQSLSVAETIFNPDLIHAHLLAKLVRLDYPKVLKTKHK